MAVAVVLFDHAKTATTAKDGLTRSELLDRVHDTFLSWEVEPPKELGDRAVNTALTRMSGRIDRLNTLLPLFEIRSVKGPTYGKRNDAVRSLWLDIDYAPTVDAGAAGIATQLAGDMVEALSADELAAIQAEMTSGKPRHLFIARGPKGRAITWTFMTLLLVVSVAVAATPSGRAFVRRVVDAITSSRSIPEMIEKLRLNRRDAMFESPGGVQAPSVRSGHGSDIRLAPGLSPSYLTVRALIEEHDAAELQKYLVPLADVGRVGVAAAQFRSDPAGPVVPWVVEIIVVPRQDAALTSELATGRARVTIETEPPLAQPSVTTTSTTDRNGVRFTAVSALHEAAHKEGSYVVRATVQREHAAAETFRATLRFNRDGFAELTREPSAAMVPVTEERRHGMPICTTILHEPVIAGPAMRLRDYVWAQAKMFDEQRVIFFVFAPSGFDPDRITVDFGDGSSAAETTETAMFVLTHRYRVGGRSYPLRMYFEGSPVVYAFDLFVFQDRARSNATTVEYVTPYPPNPDDSSLVESGLCPPGTICEVYRAGTLTPTNPTFALQELPEGFVLKSGIPAKDPRSVRYIVRPEVTAESP